MWSNETNDVMHELVYTQHAKKDKDLHLVPACFCNVTYLCLTTPTKVLTIVCTCEYAGLNYNHDAVDVPSSTIKKWCHPMTTEDVCLLSEQTSHKERFGVLSSMGWTHVMKHFCSHRFLSQSN